MIATPTELLMLDRARFAENVKQLDSCNEFQPFQIVCLLSDTTCLARSRPVIKQSRAVNYTSPR